MEGVNGRTVTYHKQMKEDLQWYLDHDVETGARAVAMIELSAERPEAGLGLPKRLAEMLHVWSRRITIRHRLYYVLLEDELRFISCRSFDMPQHLYDALRAGEDV